MFSDHCRSYCSILEIFFKNLTSCIITKIMAKCDVILHPLWQCQFLYYFILFPEYIPDFLAPYFLNKLLFAFFLVLLISSWPKWQGHQNHIYLQMLSGLHWYFCETDNPVIWQINYLLKKVIELTTETVMSIHTKWYFKSFENLD